MTSHERFIPPRTVRRLMPRDELIRRLLDARRQCCVVIQGQAGSGKTSTLLAWRSELLKLDFDIAWLSLSSEDNTLQRILRDLLASIGEVDSTIVSDAALLTDSVQSDSDIEHWVIALVQGIAKHPRDLVLMLDDMHHIGADPGISQMLQWLLDYAPANLHIVFSSRSALPLSFERLRTKGLLTELDMRDLRFSPEESERYLRVQLGDIEKADAVALHELTDGWVAGLQLFVLSLRAKEGAGYAPMHVRDAQAFASYFDREVLAYLAPDDLDMLIRASACSRFCVPLCSALLGQPSIPRVRARLERLEEDNFFVTQVGGNDREPWYRLHPLLRETLLARLMQWPEEERRKLHATACQWFSVRGDLEGSVYHAIQAGDIGHAVAMVEANAHDLLSGGDLPQVAGLLRQLPSEEIPRHFDLHITQAYLLMYARDFDACNASLMQLEARQEQLDARQRYDVLLLRCGLSVQKDDMDPVLASLPALYDIPADARDLAWTSRGNLLSWVRIFQGDYDRARHELEESRHHGGAQLSTLLGRCMGAISLARQGKLREAEQLGREVLRAAEHRGAAFAGTACIAATLLADILYELDDVDAARNLLEPRIGLIERLTLPDHVLHGFTVLSNCHRLAGRDEAMRDCIERLEAYAVRYGLDRVRAEALLLRLRDCLRQDKMDQAITAMDQLEALGNQTVHVGSLATNIMACVERARNEITLHTGDVGEAVQRAMRQMAQTEGALRPRLVELHLQCALAHDGLGDEKRAREQLLAAVRLGHRMGLLRTLLDVSNQVLPMLARLMPSHELEPVLAFYVGRLERATARVEAMPKERAAPSTVQIEALSDREQEVLMLLAQAMPNKKIARVLNVSPDTVKYHLKNIYGKLGVTARDEAVARFRDLTASKVSG